jgi:3-oxoacyl-[acyl-carrier-protein] synthase III
MKYVTRGKGRAEAPHVGIRHLCYYLPPNPVDLERLVEMKVLTPEKLLLYRLSRGLNVIHISETETASDIAVRVAAQALGESGTDPLSIDAVIFFNSVYNAKIDREDVVQRIRYELGLKRAFGFSIWGQTCASITTAIRVARDMIWAGSAESVMVVGADSLIGTKRREVEGITLMGDGGSAMIMKKDCATNRLVGVANHDEGSFYQYRGEIGQEGDGERYTMLYFIVTLRIVQKALKGAKLKLDDISVIIPHNINTSSWEMVLSMLNCDERKLYGENICRRGHAFGSDVVVNMVDAIREGRLREGEYALLLTAGMGACWGSIIIQH